MKTSMSVLVVGLALLALACGGDDETAPATDGGDAATTTPAGGDGDGDGAKYDAAASTGSLGGSVKFTGAKPAGEIFGMTSDAFCVSAWEGKEAQNEKFVLNANGSVPNAFVWAFKGPHKDLSGYETPSGFVVEQRNCFYVPHVFGVMVGQSFTVKNSDQTMHNVNVKAKRNDPFNKGQAAGDSDTVVFKKREAKIPFSCDVHSWMSATAFCLDHPFFATSDATGKFEIKGLPAGKYTFKAWHEQFGESQFEVEVGAGAASQDVTLGQ